MGTPRPTSRPGFPQLPEWLRGWGGVGEGRELGREETQHRPPERGGNPMCQGQKVTACRREHVTKKARSTSPGWLKVWLELEPVSSGSRGVGRWDGEGCGGVRTGGSTAAGWREGGKSQSRTKVTRLVKAIHVCTHSGSSLRSAGRSVAGPRCPGQGHQKGRAGRPTASWHSRGEGRKCRRRLPIQKRGENSLNNGTKMRLSPRSPASGGRGAGTAQSLRGAGGPGAGGCLAAALLPFTVLRELHHVVLLLLLLLG